MIVTDLSSFSAEICLLWGPYSPSLQVASLSQDRVIDLGSGTGAILLLSARKTQYIAAWCSQAGGLCQRSIRLNNLEGTIEVIGGHIHNVHELFSPES